MSLNQPNQKKNPSNVRLRGLFFFELGMIIISVVIVLISLGDLIWGYSQAFMEVVRAFDLIVIGIFTVDLIINFFLAEDKKRYLKRSIVTIICVVPFSSFFRLAALFRLNNLFSFFTFSVASGSRLLSRIWKFFMLPGVARISKFFNLGRSYYEKNERGHQE